MKKIIVILLFTNNIVNACDICGCFMGILPYDNQSNIAFFHRYRIFNGYYAQHQRGIFFPSGAYRVMHGNHSNNQAVDTTKKYLSSDFESYKTYELRIKWFIHSRIELNAILPFVDSRMREDTIKVKHFGLSDPTFLFGYHVIKKIHEEKFQHRLILLSGIKLPSGNYYAKDQYGNRIPLILQPGTGSVDYLLGYTYILGYKKYGLMLNTMYKINGENYYHERIANSLTMNLMTLCKIKWKDWLFIPSWQSYYEYTKGLYIQNNYILGTKMNVLLSGVGLDINYKQIALSFAGQWRLYEEKTSMDAMKSKGRMIIGLTYNFNQRNYLIKEKNQR
ncbi:MAG: hypothetical protein KatS3mg027_0327 [Bacteroidia bacterium]|nr:MAG: hypothetical protein KatS3mg027_0327 [Bacteroidia bacterium]